MKNSHITKPVLNTQDALKFASESSESEKQGHDMDKGNYLAKTALIRSHMKKISFAPEGDRRLTINIKEDLHRKLKIMAIDNETTVGDIIERLVLNYMQEFD
jgi:predicted HicB family RNase H-like nuclease